MWAESNFSLNLFISSLQWYINLQANKQKYEKGWEKSFKLVQIPLPNYLSTTKYMLKNQPSICDKIIMWNWQRKQEKKWRDREEIFFGYWNFISDPWQNLVL